MSQSFIPGAKPKFNKVYTYWIFKNYSTCECIQQQVQNVKSGWNDPLQTENTRIASLLTNTLGGKITFGNFGVPLKINYLGSVEGQPGGSFRPLRNKF